MLIFMHANCRFGPEHSGVYPAAYLVHIMLSESARQLPDSLSAQP